ncbi:MAG: hypothetical protein WC994_01950 [Brumimicrobium sp.]
MKTYKSPERMLSSISLTTKPLSPFIPLRISNLPTNRDTLVLLPISKKSINIFWTKVGRLREN